MITLTPETTASIALLAAQGLVVRILPDGTIEARAEEDARSAGARRTALYRQRKASQNVTDHHKTSQAITCDISHSPSLPLTPLSPTPPIPTLPHTPVREATAAIASAEVLKLETQQPSPPKPKKETKADPRFAPFKDAFIEAYETATGSKYAFHGGKDGSALSSFLKTFNDVSLEEFAGALNWCRKVAAADHYAKGCVKQTGSLAAFCSAWNQIVEYHQNYQPPKR